MPIRNFPQRDKNTACCFAQYLKTICDRQLQIVYRKYVMSLNKADRIFLFLGKVADKHITKPYINSGKQFLHSALLQFLSMQNIRYHFL